MKLPPLKKLYLKAYRLVGFLIITTSLTFLFGYGIVMGFFMGSRSWIAPTILSSTSDKMLQFNSAYLTALQATTALNVVLEQQNLALATSKSELEQLLTFKTSIKSGSELKQSKQVDLNQSKQLLVGLSKIGDEAKLSFKAGLITTEDAVQTQTAIQQFGNAHTDAKISLVTLQQQLLNLDYQIRQLQDAIVLEQRTIDETQNNLLTANHTLTSLRSSAYFRAVNDGSNLAFLSYNNFGKVKEGLPVYDCYLMLVVCHKVGTIKHVYKDELVIDFPVFNIQLTRTVRGVLLEMDMTDPSAMRSQIVFVGSPPILF